MYPVWRYRTRTDGVIVYNEAQDAEALAAGYVPADEVPEASAESAEDGPPEPAAPSLLEATAAAAAGAYWTDGKATKSELYLIALWLGADVAADATVDDLKEAVEAYRDADLG